MRKVRTVAMMKTTPGQKNHDDRDFPNELNFSLPLVPRFKSSIQKRNIFSGCFLFPSRTSEDPFTEDH